MIGIPIVYGITQWLFADEGVEVIFGDRGEHALFRRALFALTLALIVGFLITSIFHARRVKTLSAIEKERDAFARQLEDWKQGVKTYILGHLVTLLQEIAEYANSSQKGVDRVTVYVHDEGGFFVPIERYCPSPAYKGIGRTQYPDTEGIIAATWNSASGEVFSPPAPDKGKNPSAFFEYHRRTGVPQPVAAGLRMPSKLYYGFRVGSSDGLRQLAVVIVPLQ